MRRHVVISADGHAFGPGNGSGDTEHLDVLTEYFDPAHRSAYREHVAELRAAFAERMAGILAGLFDESATASFAAQEVLGGPTAGLFDSDRRRRDLEAEGIVAEVVFPNAVPFESSFGRTYLPELRAAGARAYNRWLADFCRDVPGRRAGMAVVAFDDIDTAVADVRAARELGLAGVVLPGSWSAEDIPPYLDPCYEPFWSACEELGLPVNVHGGATIGDVNMTAYGVAGMLTYATETTFVSTRPLTLLIWGGVFERHPDLTFVLTESRADWIPSRLAFLDAVYEDQLFAHVKDTVKHKPSEYWHRQCYVTASFMSRDEALLRHRIGLDRLLWGADYPHYEGTWPHTDRWLAATFGGLPAPEVRAILGDNAAQVFGFDLNALQPLADEVGPSVEALERHEPTGQLRRW